MKKHGGFQLIIIMEDTTIYNLRIYIYPLLTKCE